MLPWSGTLGDRTIEQHWSAPAGNSIVAMYRSIRTNQVTIYELLAIEQEGDAVVTIVVERMRDGAPASTEFKYTRLVR